MDSCFLSHLTGNDFVQFFILFLMLIKVPVTARLRRGTTPAFCGELYSPALESPQESGQNAAAIESLVVKLVVNNICYWLKQIT